LIIAHNVQTARDGFQMVLASVYIVDRPLKCKPFLEYANHSSNISETAAAQAS